MNKSDHYSVNTSDSVDDPIDVMGSLDAANELASYLVIKENHSRLWVLNTETGRVAAIHFNQSDPVTINPTN